MSRVRWSETLAHDEASSSSSLVMSAGGTTPKARKSSLKPPSVGKPHKSKSAAKRRGRQKTIEIVDVAEAWRERGKIFRARLIMNDEKSGGDAFTLSNDCEIEKYYDVAERVGWVVAGVFVLCKNYKGSYEFSCYSVGLGTISIDNSR